MLLIFQKRDANVHSTVVGIELKKKFGFQISVELLAVYQKRPRFHSIIAYPTSMQWKSTFISKNTDTITVSIGIR